LSEPVKRQYEAPRRQEQARQTRRAVLRAAHDLFVERGYGRTTIADIARGAGVSPETIYATFRNKVTLLHQVWDVTIGGDDEHIVFHERPEIVAMRAEPRLATRLAMHARMFTSTARRVTPFLLALQGAAGADPAAAEMLTEIGRQRYTGMGVMAADAAATGELAVSEQECRDVIWASTDGMLWHRLVEERGWSDERFAEWLARTWVATLVKPARRGPAKRLS
jgi:AcrR family transcriptional regulator